MLSDVHLGMEGVALWCMAYTCKCTDHDHALYKSDSIGATMQSA